MPRIAITKRWPGEHCFRATVWVPSHDAMSYSSVAVESVTPREVAELMITLMTCGRRLSQSTLADLQTLSNSIKGSRAPKKADT